MILHIFDIVYNMHYDIIFFQIATVDNKNTETGGTLCDYKLHI